MLAEVNETKLHKRINVNTKKEKNIMSAAGFEARNLLILNLDCLAYKYSIKNFSSSVLTAVIRIITA
jgi:hypothetical protein